ncbi:MAG: hypothetical protein N3B21_08495 [Clostridia bacterium]|nr:hypothetical protein [Clostridia bacterium]
MNSSDRSKKWEGLSGIAGVLVERRLNKLEKELYCTDRYKELSAREQSLYCQLEEALPDHLKPVLSDYSDLLYTILNIQEDYYYQHGFTDAFALTLGLEDRLSDDRMDV